MEDGNTLRKMLAQPLEPGPLRDELDAMGLPPTYENGVRLQLIRKAAGGDLSAVKYVLGALEPPEDALPEIPDEDTLRALPTSVLRKMARYREEEP